MNPDPYIFAARCLLVVACVLAAVGLGMLVVCIIDSAKVQRQSNEIDRQLAQQACSICGKQVRECRDHLARDPDQATIHAREWRRHFDEHCAVNPTFPQT